MNRTAIVAITLAVVLGSVPAAATLSGAQTTPEAGPAPGAAFAGVVDVQEAEVDSEVAQRSLDRQFAAAESNGSKARIVAEQQGHLQERLNELEAEKARLERAHENGSIGQGQYQARLAALAAQLRAVERRANQTATVADSLPEQALREHGADVSQIRSVAQQANSTGGGEVAEAARAIAGESVGNGLGPPNASARGPPESVDPSERSRPNRNDSTTGPPDGAGQDVQNSTENRPSPADVNGSVTGDSPSNAVGSQTNGTGGNGSGEAPNGGSEVPTGGNEVPNGTNEAPNSSTTGTPVPDTEGDSEPEDESGTEDDRVPRGGNTTVTATPAP
ncbi:MULTISPECIES: hypothetical protein [Halolamina]|uniref:Uncharacterized protein n=1 Tax=Halolamina pelagica TaxID=699431 RepID=A0A1I5SKD7_9EURY|nr:MULTISPECIES: hypothetical protein [Halolamina]NHX37018.1 hypothetical protein [Halolamina sp. R1-12]SFP71195.1 hypothetical protein SAMN05216277_106160 [Halolamina pelagica]